MDKEKLLDFLIPYDDILYHELMQTDDVSAFVKKHPELREFPGYAEIEKPEKDLTTIVLGEFGKDLKNDISEYPEVYLEEKAEKMGISEDALKSELSTLIEGKKYQEGRKRREEEIANAGFFSPWTLASEYSKQRYIDNPDASIFGKEGNFNPLSTEGQNELRDVILGGAGAVGDLIPGVGGVLLGPAARAIRSGYEGDLSVSDIGTDIALNAGTSFAPTAILNKGKRYLTNAKGEMGAIGKGIENVQEALYTDAKLNTISKSIASSKSEALGTTKTAMEWARNLPESPFKSEMMGAIKNGETGKALKDRISTWDKALKGSLPTTMTPNTSKYAQNLKSKSSGAYDAAFSKSTRPDIDDPWSKLAYIIGKNYPTVGEAAVKESFTAKGRDPKIVETLDDKIARWEKGYATIDEMKTSEYNEWKLNKLLGY